MGISIVGLVAGDDVDNEPGATIMRRTIYEMNHGRLTSLLGPLDELVQGRSYKLKAGGFMDLTVERLPDCPETGLEVISMVHYHEVNGDMCQDPEMTVRIMPQGFAEALMLQQTTPGMPMVYRTVYPSQGKVDINAKKSLNKFLGTWLRNLKSQGHSL